MLDLHIGQIKNVAVLLSGECRTYNKCAQSIKHFFDLPNINVKYFGHAWNTNTYKRNVDGVMSPVLESHDKQHILEDIQKYYPFEKIKVEEKFVQYSSWDNLFYSDAQANLLKKQYEFDNNMIFDIVVKCRYDLAFNPKLTLLDIIPNNRVLHQKTLYSEMFLMIKEWYLPNIDDVFFFGTSLTMDTVMSNMPYVVNRMYDEMYPSMKQYDNPFYKAGPGVNMYRWIVQQNIIVHRVLRSFQIYRIHDIPLDPVIDYHQIMRNQRTTKLH